MSDGYCGSLSSHPGVIYEKCVEAELHGYWGMYKQGSSWVPPDQAVQELPYGKLPSDIVTETYLKYSDVLRDFDQYQQMPRPSDFDGLIASMETVVAYLAIDSGVEVDQQAAVPARIDAVVFQVNTLTADWSGKASDTFRKKVLGRLQDNNNGMFAMAFALLEGAKAEQKIWEAAWADVDKVAHDTVTALDTGGSLSPATEKAYGWVAKAIDIVSIGGPLAVLGTIKTAAELTFDVLKAFDSLDPLCDHRDPEGVVAAMRSKLDAVNETIRTAESDLASAWADNLAKAEGKYDVPLLGALAPGEVNRNPGELD